MNVLKSKKGTLADAPEWVWAIVTVGIFAGVGAIVLSEFADTLTSTSVEYAAVKNASNAIANLSQQLPTVGTVLGVLLIVAAVAVMAVYFGKKMY